MAKQKCSWCHFFTKSAGMNNNQRGHCHKRSARDIEIREGGSSDGDFRKLGPIIPWNKTTTVINCNALDVYTLELYFNSPMTTSVAAILANWGLVIVGSTITITSIVYVSTTHWTITFTSPDIGSVIGALTYTNTNLYVNDNVVTAAASGSLICQTSTLENIANNIAELPINAVTTKWVNDVGVKIDLFFTVPMDNSEAQVTGDWTFTPGGAMTVAWSSAAWLSTTNLRFTVTSANDDVNVDIVVDYANGGGRMQLADNTILKGTTGITALAPGA